jgi:hypothetical protein
LKPAWFAKCFARARAAFGSHTARRLFGSQAGQARSRRSPPREPKILGSPRTGAQLLQVIRPGCFAHAAHRGPVDGAAAP